MSQSFTCDQGHSWDTPVAQEGDTPPLCPQCGGAPQTQAPDFQTRPPNHALAEEQGWPALPDYEILGELGRGGMGVVYKARNVRLQRVVALKMIRAADGTRPEAHKQARFQAEAEVLAAFKHPHIVQLYEAGEVAGCPYFSMEYVEGDGLHRRIAGTVQRAAQLTETLARAIHYVHQRGIVHRDLKPANVLLTEEETPKITDFGLAKHFNADNGLTASGAVMGTPHYMAPEQAAGRLKEIGPHTDVWALGAILYELLTGKPPFWGETVAEVIDQVLRSDPTPPGTLRPKTPAPLETICLKCLEKKPRRRYATAADLAEDLRRFLENERIVARPPNVLRRVSRWAGRHPAFVRLLLLVAILGVSPVLTLAGSHYLRSAAAAALSVPEAEDALRAAEAKLDQAKQAAAVYPGKLEAAKAIMENSNQRIEVGQKLEKSLMEGFVGGQNIKLSEVIDQHREMYRTFKAYGDTSERLYEVELGDPTPTLGRAQAEVVSAQLRLAQAHVATGASPESVRLEDLRVQEAEARYEAAARHLEFSRRLQRVRDERREQQERLLLAIEGTVRNLSFYRKTVNDAITKAGAPREWTVSSVDSLEVAVLETQAEQSSQQAKLKEFSAGDPAADIRRAEAEVEVARERLAALGQPVHASSSPRTPASGDKPAPPPQPVLEKPDDTPPPPAPPDAPAIDDKPMPKKKTDDDDGMTVPKTSPEEVGAQKGLEKPEAARVRMAIRLVANAVQKADAAVLKKRLIRLTRV